jgi:hypothetical protein
MKIKKWLAPLALILLSAFALFPQYYTKYPTLIDDGSDILYARSHSFLGIIIDQFLSEIERFRPLKFIFRKILYYFFGLNISLHFLCLSLILTSICLLVFLILKKLNVSNFIAFFGSLFILSLPSVYSSFYRLGPDEPVQAFILLSGIYFFLNRKKWSALILFAFNLLVKETSIFFLTIPIYISLREKNKKYFLTSFLLFVLYSVLLITRIIKLKSNQLNQILSPLIYLKLNLNFLRGTIIWFVVISIILTYITIKLKIQKQQLIIIILSVLSNLIIVFVWLVNDFYYVFLIHILLVISTFFIIDLLKKSNPKRLKSSITIIFFALFSFTYIILFKKYNIKIIKYWHVTNICQGQLVNYLLNKDFSNSDVYSGVTSFEENDKIHLYINQWNKGNKSFTPSMASWWYNCCNNDRSYNINLAKNSQLTFSLSDSKEKIFISEKIIPDFENKYKSIHFQASTPFVNVTCPYTIYLPK